MALPFTKTWPASEKKILDFCQRINVSINSMFVALPTAYMPCMMYPCSQYVYLVISVDLLPPQNMKMEHMIACAICRA